MCCTVIGLIYSGTAGGGAGAGGVWLAAAGCSGLAPGCCGRAGVWFWAYDSSGTQTIAAASAVTAMRRRKVGLMVVEFMDVLRSVQSNRGDVTTCERRSAPRITRPALAV